MYSQYRVPSKIILSLKLEFWTNNCKLGIPNAEHLENAWFEISFWSFQEQELMREHQTLLEKQRLFRDEQQLYQSAAEEFQKVRALAVAANAFLFP